MNKHTAECLRALKIYEADECANPPAPVRDRRKRLVEYILLRHG